MGPKVHDQQRHWGAGVDDHPDSVLINRSGTFPPPGRGRKSMINSGSCWLGAAGAVGARAAGVCRWLDGNSAGHVECTVSSQMRSWRLESDCTGCSRSRPGGSCGGVGPRWRCSGISLPWRVCRQVQPKEAVSPARPPEVDQPVRHPSVAGKGPEVHDQQRVGQRASTTTQIGVDQPVRHPSGAGKGPKVRDQQRLSRGGSGGVVGARGAAACR